MQLGVFDHMDRSQAPLGQYYEDRLRLIEAYDQAGFHGYHVAEHHATPLGVAPAPVGWLAAIAQRTTRIRLGTGISVRTFHNPLDVAENYAMLDVLSGGRLTLGVGSGYLKHEFEGYGIDGAERRERFDEALQFVERLLRGGRITQRGRFTTRDGVQINVLPLQRNVPLYVAVLRKEVAYHVGRQGRPMLCVPYAGLDRFEEIGEMVAEFRRGREEIGITDHTDTVTIALHTYVADSDADAKRDAAAAFDLYVATRLYAKSAVYDDLLRKGLCLFGAPDTVAAKLRKLEAMGVDHVATLQNFGGLDDALVQRSMRQLMRDAVPLSRATPVHAA
jgi:alkanesulfonate monooxygenase SsuD/methylene tetrahydromethanopterin reductase-like flavin-dependent oxidoreductase (luciferase family)